MRTLHEIFGKNEEWEATILLRLKFAEEQHRYIVEKPKKEKTNFGTNWGRWMPTILVSE